MLATLVVGCSKEECVENIVFNVAVSEVNSYNATMIVTHNATNDDAYYGFVVKGEVSDINYEIKKFLSHIDKTSLQQKVHYQRKQLIRVSGLVPNTTYTYIAFGMNGIGERYGRPAITEFTTLDSDMVASINPNWSVVYKGYVEHNYNDRSLVTVYVAGQVKERYVLATTPVDVIRRYERIEPFIDSAAMATLNKLQNQNSAEPWFEDNEIRTGSTNFYRVLTPGDYMSCAIGLDEFGKPTGHYAMSEVFHVDEYPLDEAYANLLDLWLLTDASYKTYLVSFKEDVRNHSLIMVGWGNLTQPVVPILVSFDRKDGSISISEQLIFDNYKKTFSDGVTLEGILSLRGTYVDEEGSRRNVNNVRAEANLMPGGYYEFPGFVKTNQDTGQPYKTAISLYIDGQERNAWYATMTFPFTMEKIEL